MSILGACTIGEPEGSALTLVEPATDGSANPAEAGDDLGSSTTDDDLGSAAPADANELRDAGTTTVGNAATAGGAQCSPMILNCNPVQKTGCLDFLGQQCVVDPEAMQPAGRCVFMDATPQDGGVCAEDFLRTTCKPGTGCHDGACRTLCTCDSQCESGSCCTGEASPKSGNVLKYCGECR